jgi:hypothetical protein
MYTQVHLHSILILIAYVLVTLRYCVLFFVLIESIFVYRYTVCSFVNPFFTPRNVRKCPLCLRALFYLHRRKKRISNNYSKNNRKHMLPVWFQLIPRHMYWSSKPYVPYTRSRMKKKEGSLMKQTLENLTKTNVI